jgi:hypothetical protein
LHPQATLETRRYVLLALQRNPAISVHTSNLRISGTMALVNGENRAVSNFGAQAAPPDSGVDSFPFWIPERRPGGHNLALSIDPPLDSFAPANVANGVARPTNAPNTWVADPADPAPTLHLTWNEPQQIGRIELTFDTDADHAMESVLMGHPEQAMPFCVRDYRVCAGEALVAEVQANHQTRNSLRFDPPLHTADLSIEIQATHGAPAAIVEVRCYAE